MKTEYILGIAISLILIILVFQYFQLNKGITSSKGIDMAGWTENERMNYEHHGTMPTRLSGNTKTTNIDMTGWTENERMNYEHHGTMPNR